jgi:hypothetical protein
MLDLLVMQVLGLQANYFECRRWLSMSDVIKLLRLSLMALLAAFAVHAAPRITPLNGCLVVQMQPPSPTSEPDSGVQVKLTNNCGKDITAYELRITDESGKLVAGFGQDMLARYSAPGTSGTLRDGAAKSVDVSNAPSPSGAVSVSAVLFLDGSAGGDPTDVEPLLSRRRSALGMYEARLALLKTFSTWSSTSGLRQRAEETQGFQGTDLKNLLDVLNRSDASSWDSFVKREREDLNRVIKLYQDSFREAHP